MRPEEVIRFRIDRRRARGIMRKSIRYAIMSIPFTIDRMNIRNLPRRIINIAKGKFAEGVFEAFVQENGIDDIDFHSTRTPYYRVDMGDFLLGGYQFDLKNNFLRCSGFSERDVVKFLALVPDRHKRDQWRRRFRVDDPKKSHRGKAFLFTFMRHIHLKIENLGEIIPAIRDYWKRFRGRPQEREPEEFRRRMDYLIRKHNLRAEYTPPKELLITAYANREYFHMFRYIPPGYIFETRRGEECFRTKIKNRGVEIEKLPPFESLIE